MTIDYVKAPPVLLNPCCEFWVVPLPIREQFLKPSGTIEGNYRDTFLLQLCNHGFNRRAPGRFQRYGKSNLGARSLRRDDTDTAGSLKDHLLHDDDKGLERFFDRHNHYTSLEPVEIMRERLKAGGEKHGGNFFERGPQRRRAFQVFGPALSAVPPAFPAYLYAYFEGWFSRWVHGSALLSAQDVF